MVFCTGECPYVPQSDWTENLRYSFHNTNTTHWFTPPCKQAVVFKHSTTPRYCPCCCPGVTQSFPAHSQFRVPKKWVEAMRAPAAPVWCCRVGLCFAGISIHVWFQHAALWKENKKQPWTAWRVNTSTWLLSAAFGGARHTRQHTVCCH